MLDMEFISDIRRLLALMSIRRQNVLFSATFPDNIDAIANDLLGEADRIQVRRPNSMPKRSSETTTAWHRNATLRRWTSLRAKESGVCRSGLPGTTDKQMRNQIPPTACGIGAPERRSGC